MHSMILAALLKKDAHPDRIEVDRMVAGGLLDAANRALQLAVTPESLRVALANAQAAVDCIARMEGAFAAAALRGRGP